MYNQNFETSKFSFYQIEKVIDSIEKNFGGKRVLVIIHEGRLKPHLINREDLQILNKLKANKSLYVAPYGSNDDWYWMFAALNSLHTSPFDGKVVTNDHMRDHHFQLLHPFYFRLWRERHVVRFDFERGQLFFLSAFQIF
jgi:proteinaceous RNase P